MKWHGATAWLSFRLNFVGDVLQKCCEFMGTPLLDALIASAKETFASWLDPSQALRRDGLPGTSLLWNVNMIGSEPLLMALMHRYVSAFDMASV
jgi:hypothetical protein